MRQNFKKLKSELETYKKFNKNSILFELDNYINKIIKRLRDKQEYIKFLSTVIKENNIEIPKGKFKEFKKENREKNIKKKKVDFYCIEKEELYISPILNSKEAPEKVKDPEIIPCSLAQGKKQNVLPPIIENLQEMCNKSMVAVEIVPGIPKIEKGIIGEPKGLGVGKESFIKENIEILRSPYSISSAVDEDVKVPIDYEENQEIVEDIKEKINKLEFESLNLTEVDELEDLSKEQLKNILNYLKRKMKKIKGGFDKLQYMSFKAALEMVCENKQA